MPIRVHENEFPRRVCQVAVVAVQGLEQVTPDARRHQELELGAPIVHEHHCVDIGSTPELELLQVELMDQPQQLTRPLLGVHHVKEGILAAAQELVTLPWPRATAPPDELVGATAEAVDPIAGRRRICRQSLIGRPHRTPVAQIGKQGLLDLTDDAVLDVLPDTAPVVDVGAHVEHVTADARRGLVAGGRTGEVGRVGCQQAVQTRFDVALCPRQVPHLAGQSFGEIEGQGTVDQFARCLGHTGLLVYGRRRDPTTYPPAAPTQG